MSFTDFPDDVLLCVLSFLSPADVSSFALASKGCDSLCRRTESRIWFAMCHRRWGSKAHISAAANISHRLLYRTLSRWDDLIGFWRRSGGAGNESPPLVLFEWGPSSVHGSRISPSRDGTYGVLKSPFLRLSLSSDGEISSFMDPSGGGDLVPVSVSVFGRTHFVVEEEEDSSSRDLREEEEEEDGDGWYSDFGSPGSLPERVVAEVYQQVANRTSPASDRAARRQRRRERERRARRRKWDPQHFVKVVHCSPTPSRPLQGLWKGICGEEMNLCFYLITYDDVGCITCRKVWNSPENRDTRLFWFSDTSFLEFPFPAEEQSLYRRRLHLRPIPDPDDIIETLSLEQNSSGELSRILFLDSMLDSARGRVWQYEDGTFGFGFLQDNLVIDLKSVSDNGRLLDSLDS